MFLRQNSVRGDAARFLAAQVSALGEAQRGGGGKLATVGTETSSSHWHAL